jgi:putative FmdB family regulatory protein
MPLYEYECKDCEHAFEKLVSGDESVVECPQCRGKKLQRLLSVPAKPRSSASTSSLPMSCNSSGPPCGPQCSRWE